MPKNTALPKELQQRIDTLESFWFAHGGAPYEGITIGEFLTQAHQDTAQVELERIKTAFHEWCSYSQYVTGSWLGHGENPRDKESAWEQFSKLLDQLAPSEQKEQKMLENSQELKDWKISEVEKILDNSGFDNRKKLMAIRAVVSSDTILDGRHASTNLQSLQSSKEHDEKAN